MEWIVASAAIVSSLITGIVTYSVSGNQTNSSVEQEYTKNITNLFTFYKEQVDALRTEVEQLKTQIKELESKYVKDISGYKVLIEKLEVEVGSLKTENADLRVEVATLKGEKQNGI